MLDCGTLYEKQQKVLRVDVPVLDFAVFSNQQSNKSSISKSGTRIVELHEYVLTTSIVSIKAVPLTIIKGAGNEYIPIPEGESAIVADFHSYVPLTILRR